MVAKLLQKKNKKVKSMAMKSNYQLVHKWKSQAQGDDNKFQDLPAMDVRHAQAI